MNTAAVVTTEQLEDLVDDYLQLDSFVFDVETLAGREPRYPKDQPQGDPRTNIPFWISLAGPGRADAIPMGHPPPAPRQLSRSEVFRALEPLFFSDRLKINQNIKFDLLSIAKEYKGKLPPGPYGDTLVLVHTLNENLVSKGGYNLGNLVQRYLHFSYTKLGELGPQNFSFAEACEYSYLDAKTTWLLWRKMSRQLARQPKLQRVFDVEMELLEVLLSMAQTGALVDPRGFERLEADLTKRMAEIKERTYEAMGRRISFTSNPQKAHYIYEELGLPCQMYTDKEKPSVSEAALKPLAGKHPAIRGFLDYAAISKLHSTFVKGFAKHIDDDNRLRSNYKQGGTTTGRLSSSKPNLQNVPIREKAEGKLVRALFLAPNKWSLVVADYGAIELRVLAHYCQDKALLQAFRQRLDLHAFTASRMLNIPIEEVDAEQRALGKKCNFLLAYGGSWMILAIAGGMKEPEAKRQHKNFHNAYPGIDRWTQQTIAIGRRQGGVETILGRKRRLPDLNHPIDKLRRRAERQAVNTVIQGGAADVFKLGTIDVFNALRETQWKLTLHVHDELIAEVPDDERDDAVALFGSVMEDVRLDGKPILSVPLVVDVHAVKRWSDAK